MKFRFDKKLVKTHIHAEDQQAAIRIVAQLLIDQGYVNEAYPQEVIKREKDYPTGLITRGATIAIPHSFSPNVKGNHIAIGVLDEPVIFHNMEDLEQCIPVKIIFMLAIGNAHSQLEMLQVLMQMFKEEALLKDIVSQCSADTICKMLNAYIEAI